MRATLRIMIACLTASGAVLATLSCAAAPRIGKPDSGDYSPAPEIVLDSNTLPILPLWTHKGKAYFGSNPVPAGNRLIIPTRKGKLEYVDPNSGRRTAEVKAKYSLEQSPVVAQDYLFLTTEYPRKRLQALEVSTGKRLWHRDFRHTLGQPIQVGEELWVPVGDTVAAFTLDKGAPTRNLVAGGDRWLSLTPGPGGFALLGARGSLRYLDSSGAEVWQHELQELCAEPPVITGRDVVVVTASGSVVKVRSSTEEVWRQRVSSDYLYAPTVAGDIAYVVGRDGEVRALALATGESVWSQTLGAPGAGSALVRGDWLAVTSVDGKLWFLDRMDGAVRDSVVFQALIHHPPVWAFGRLYVVTADKRAHAFGMGP